jgi:hypothetical protein
MMDYLGSIEKLRADAAEQQSFAISRSITLSEKCSRDFTNTFPARQRIGAGAAPSKTG